MKESNRYKNKKTTRENAVTKRRQKMLRVGYDPTISRCPKVLTHEIISHVIKPYESGALTS